MKKLITTLLSFITIPAVLFKRYFEAQSEIKIVKAIDASLPQSLIENARLIANRKAMLEKIGERAIVAEVGVASGDFAEQIWKNCTPQKLHLIDIWAEGKRAYGADPIGMAKRLLGSGKSSWEAVNDRFEDAIKLGQVCLNKGYSWEVLAEMPDAYFDLIYLDAGHDFKSVQKDLEICQQKIKPNGIIAGHDYTRWGRFGSRMGVVEAVNRFCIDYDFELIYLTVETRTNASFAIQKRASS